MAHSLRIATFNCQNLFSRPRIFNATAERTNELLGYVAELQQALKQPVFDLHQIDYLKRRLEGYAVVNDLRFSHERVQGAESWLGSVDLIRSGVDEPAVLNTARVISDVDADLICLIEVEDRPALQKFHDQVLNAQFLEPAGKAPYPHVLLIDGNDSRGIDVAVLSRLPVRFLGTHIHERTEYDGRLVETFSRDCLEVHARLPDGQPLVVMINHLKSMREAPPQDPDWNRRRRGQAQRIAELVADYDLRRDYVIVAGDLNADPSSPALAPLIDHPELYNTLLELPPDQRGTHRHYDSQLDYLLVSEALRQHLLDVRVERRGIHSKFDEWATYPSVTSNNTQASDHAAVVADFVLP